MFDSRSSTVRLSAFFGSRTRSLLCARCWLRRVLPALATCPCFPPAALRPLQLLPCRIEVGQLALEQDLHRPPDRPVHRRDGNPRHPRIDVDVAVTSDVLDNDHLLHHFCHHGLKASNSSIEGNAPLKVQPLSSSVTNAGGFCMGQFSRFIHGSSCKRTAGFSSTA